MTALYICAVVLMWILCGSVARAVLDRAGVRAPLSGTLAIGGPLTLIGLLVLGVFAVFVWFASGDWLD